MTEDNVPDLLERRKAVRVVVPHGTLSLFYLDGGTLHSFNVRDISFSGMLICNASGKRVFNDDEDVDGICIFSGMACPASGSKKLAFVCNGRVVHSFFDELSRAMCYGFEFNDTSPYRKQQLAGVMQEITPLTGTNLGELPTMSCPS